VRSSGSSGTDPVVDGDGHRRGGADADASRWRRRSSPTSTTATTVFGGSAAAVAILSAWGLLFVACARSIPTPRSSSSGTRCVTSARSPGAFTASSFLADPGAWDRFVTTYRRRKLARVSVSPCCAARANQVGEARRGIRRPRTEHRLTLAPEKHPAPSVVMLLQGLVSSALPVQPHSPR